MANDKIASPPKTPSGRSGTPIQAKSGIIEGPTGATGNLNPFNRGKGSKK